MWAGSFGKSETYRGVQPVPGLEVYEFQWDVGAIDFFGDRDPFRVDVHWVASLLRFRANVRADRVDVMRPFPAEVR